MADKDLVVVRDPKDPNLVCECADPRAGGLCGASPAGHFALEGWPDTLVLCAECEADRHDHG